MGLFIDTEFNDPLEDMDDEVYVRIDGQFVKVSGGEDDAETNEEQ